jgi:hypothetical protein
MFLIGGLTGWYWDFFPAPRGWGRIPVWGFGKVVASEVERVETGEDLFGYFPMSTHAVLKPGKIRSDGLHDASEHRAHLSPAYNYYMRTFANPTFDAESKREIMLLRPLFFASFLVRDLLAERVGADADTIAITSARKRRCDMCNGRFGLVRHRFGWKQFLLQSLPGYLSHLHHARSGSLQALAGVFGSQGMTRARLVESPL